MIISIAIILLTIVGIISAYRSYAPGKKRMLFSYYTNLSNMMVALYHFCFTVFRFDAPGLRVAMTTDITLTMLVYAFILTPEYRRQQKNGKDIKIYSFHSCILHYAVPALCILSCLLSGETPFWTDCWMAIAAPLLYTVVIMIRAPFRGNLPGRRTPYPYTFMDVGKLGARRVLVNVTIVAIAVLAVDCGYIALLNLL